MVGICRDVTERQKLLRELRARAKQQETVARLGERALTESDLQALFEEIVTTIAGTLDVEFVKKIPLISLAELRKHRELADMRVLAKGNRLSITPVTEAEWRFITERLA